MAGPSRKTIGSYEVEGELGQGGMGVVHLARQPELDRHAVIKALRRSLSDDEESTERFRREAQAAAGIHHQNIVAVYDCFTWRGERFIAQEYVAGADLASVLQVVHRLSPRVAGLVALELARGLEEVHAQDVVHRDLKPGNVLLGRRGECKIADFGIALEPRKTTLTQVGHALGTVGYMSPEQLRGERPDARSDLYSFGVVLYEMVTGDVPYADGEDDSDAARRRRIEAGRYVPPRSLVPEVPRALARLIRDCLRPKPKRRLQTATDLRARLERLLGDPSPAACRAEIAGWLWERKVFRAGEEETEVAIPPAPRRPAGWRRFGLGLAACAAVLAGAGAIHVAGVVPPGANAPARVRVEATPGTLIRVDGGAAFGTPQAGFLELPPGLHHIEFRHPEFGPARREISLAAGEERVVHHDYESADDRGGPSEPAP
ncbi:MAG: serine/threonine-protein kinase [Myxococcota bacterium]